VPTYNVQMGTSDRDSLAPCEVHALLRMAVRGSKEGSLAKDVALLVGALAVGPVFEVGELIATRGREAGPSFSLGELRAFARVALAEGIVYDLFDVISTRRRRLLSSKITTAVVITERARRNHSVEDYYWSSGFLPAVDPQLPTNRLTPHLNRLHVAVIGALADRGLVTIPPSTSTTMGLEDAGWLTEEGRTTAQECATTLESLRRDVYELYEAEATADLERLVVERDEDYDLFVLSMALGRISPRVFSDLDARVPSLGSLLRVLETLRRVDFDDIWDGVRLEELFRRSR